MINIELTPYEKNNLVRMLDYTADCKRRDYKKGKITSEYYGDFLDQLFILRERINGVKPDVHLTQKSLISDILGD